MSADLDTALARPRAAGVRSARRPGRGTEHGRPGAGRARSAGTGTLRPPDSKCNGSPIPDSIADDPVARDPRQSYEGRYDVVGQRGDPRSDRTLLINGHIDVVPAEDVSAWTSPPFTAVRT